MTRLILRYGVLGLTLAMAGGLLVACGDDDGGTNNVNQNNQSNDNNSNTNQNNDNGNANQNNNNNTTEYGCTEACTDMVAEGCDEGPTTVPECVEGCGAAQVMCPTELGALFTCVGTDPVVTCDASGAVVFEGCEAENEAMEACMDAPPDYCEESCPDVVAEACENGPTDLEDCVAGCQQTLFTCPDEWQAVADCGGAEPVFECNEAGSPVVTGCDAANEALWACLYEVPEVCVDVCPAVVAAECSDGPPTTMECWDGCGEAMQMCGTEFSAWVACGGADPTFTCDVDGSPIIAGCEDEGDLLYACMGG